MATHQPCRLILDPAPGRGSWNMAVDEALLESAVRNAAASVRIYQWSEPTVSLGYFQAAADVEREPRLSGLPAVRRLTGGGAILHHHEITYACCLPAGHPLAQNAPRLYGIVHDAIISVLLENGVPARRRGAGWSAEQAPFLCFGRGDANDVVVGDHKVVGSAQRRRRGAVLQHGSVLLRKSQYAEAFPGLSDLTARALGDRGLIPALAMRIAAVLGDAGPNGGLTGPERRLAERLQREKYERLIWPRACQSPRGGAARRLVVNGLDR